MHLRCSDTLQNFYRQQVMKWSIVGIKSQNKCLKGEFTSQPDIFPFHDFCLNYKALSKRFNQSQCLQLLHY